RGVRSPARRSLYNASSAPSKAKASPSFTLKESPARDQRMRGFGRRGAPSSGATLMTPAPDDAGLDPARCGAFSAGAAVGAAGLAVAALAGAVCSDCGGAVVPPEAGRAGTTDSTGCAGLADGATCGATWCSGTVKDGM